MVTTTREGYIASERTYRRHVFEEGVTLDTNFKGVLLIDARRIRQSVIQFFNAGANPLEYKVFGNASFDPVLLQSIDDPSAIDQDDSDWINLISVIEGQTGTTYDHTTVRTINAGLRFYESFTNEWFAVLVQARSAVGTTLDIWHRGQS